MARGEGPHQAPTGNGRAVGQEGITDVIRWQRALRRPRDDTFHVRACSSPLPTKRGLRSGGPADRYVSERGGIDPEDWARAPTSDPLRDAKTVSDGLACGDDHVVVFLEDDDVGGHRSRRAEDAGRDRPSQGRGQPQRRRRRPAGRRAPARSSLGSGCHQLPARGCARGLGRSGRPVGLGGRPRWRAAPRRRTGRVLRGRQQRRRSRRRWRRRCPQPTSTVRGWHRRACPGRATAPPGVRRARRRLRRTGTWSSRHGPARPG